MREQPLIIPMSNGYVIFAEILGVVLFWSGCNYCYMPALHSGSLRRKAEQKHALGGRGSIKRVVLCQSQKKVCNGYGPEECRTVYESSCSTRYVEKKPGKHVADTKCKKLPIKDCNSTELNYTTAKWRSPLPHLINSANIFIINQTQFSSQPERILKVLPFFLLQGWAKEFTQPKDHSFAQPCISALRVL